LASQSFVNLNVIFLFDLQRSWYKKIMVYKHAPGSGISDAVSEVQPHRQVGATFTATSEMVFITLNRVRRNTNDATAGMRVSSTGQKLVVCSEPVLVNLPDGNGEHLAQAVISHQNFVRNYSSDLTSVPVQARFRNWLIID